MIHGNDGKRNAAKAAADRADAHLHIRVRKQDLAAWKRHAKKLGITLSVWVNSALSGYNQEEK